MEWLICTITICNKRYICIRHLSATQALARVRVALPDGSFSCVVKTQRRWSNKIYKTELTKIRYNNQVLCKYRVDPHRAGLTLIEELTCQT